ncbi:response regulator [Aquimarina brevivitae]|uniref:CheY-like chemotaxis protein n=1 Tax=Aquimarina brevivitae TaxID=323412 RepID=A0A4Q7P3G6_9FLAO|nr:response regulator [Aquimarina brevivitae]RZS93950.1 CheY-like chemotaxis protein [Aquimarina brevivitae]
MQQHVFIIDDDPIFRLMSKKMISNLAVPKLSIIECEDGQIGIEQLSKLRASKDNVVILLDINMPILDGWNFLEELEKQHRFDLQQVTVCMVTSSTDDSDVHKAKKYKLVKKFVHKPLHIDDLKSLLG